MRRIFKTLTAPVLMPIPQPGWFAADGTAARLSGRQAGGPGVDP